jgi:hypothetical protein
MLSGRDFDPTFGALFRHVAYSDWTNQNLGKTSLRGWAVNSLYGYRYILSFQYWLTPSNRQRLAYVRETITAQGFTPLYGYSESDTVPSPGSGFQRIDSAVQQGFDQILQLQNEGFHVLFIDAPIRPDLYSIQYDNFFKPYIEYMQAALDERAIPFWLTADISKSIPVEGWYDIQHINEIGVPVLSAWLGNQLAQNYPPEFFK